LLSFLPSFLAIVAALVFPTLVGLLLVSGAARLARAKYLAAFGLGIYLWFFSDTIGDAAYLDVNAGFGGGAVQVALVLLFIVGVVLLFSLDRTSFRADSDAKTIGFAIPLLVALAVGFHGFGEGAAFIATAGATSATGLLDAFGGLSAAVAFMLHKALEPMMIGAAYWVYARDHAKSTTARAKDTLLLALVFVVPGIVGGATDYSSAYDTTYFFAFGLGTSIYAAVRLARPLFQDSDGSKWESLKVAIALMLGFLSLYSAALLHS
jgi:zinc transporter ZupT